MLTVNYHTFFNILRPFTSACWGVISVCNFKDQRKFRKNRVVSKYDTCLLMNIVLNICFYWVMISDSLLQRNSPDDCQIVNLLFEDQFIYS